MNGKEDTATRGRTYTPGSAEDHESGQQLSSEEVKPEVSRTHPRQRGTPMGDIASPEANIVDKVGGEILKKFESMFIEYQMEVNRTTAEAVREAMDTV